MYWYSLQPAVLTERLVWVSRVFLDGLKDLSHAMPLSREQAEHLSYRNMRTTLVDCCFFPKSDQRDKVLLHGVPLWTFWAAGSVVSS